MQIKTKLCRKQKITQLNQTFNDGDNTCSFLYNSIPYHGKGRQLTGTNRILFNRAYMWQIFDNENKVLFSFGTNDATEPISKRKLTRWMNDYRKEQKSKNKAQ